MAAQAIAEWKDSQGGSPAKRRGAVGQGAAADGDGDEAAVPSQEDLVLSFLTNRPATA